MAGYNVGKAFVQVVPSFDKTQLLIGKFFAGMKPIDIPAHLDPKHLKEEVSAATKKASKGAKVDVGQVDADFSLLNRNLDLLRSKSRGGLNLGNADADFSEVNRRLAELSTVNIDIPVDANTKLLNAKLVETQARNISILANIDLNLPRLEEKLRALQATHPSLLIDGDLKIAAVRAQIEALRRERIRIEAQVHLDSSKLDFAEVNRKLAAMPKVDIPVGADTTVANAKLDAVAARRLSVIADIDLNLTKLYAELARLQSLDPTIHADVDLNIAAVQARIAALQTQRVHIRAEVDAAKAIADLAALDVAANRLDGKNVNVNAGVRGASRVLGILALITAATAAIGYAAPAAVAALATLPTALAVAGQGLGALVIGFNGIGGALKAMQLADQEGMQKATAHATARVSASNQIAGATAALEGAQTQADRAATTGAEQVQSAREGLARAQEGLASAQESALQRVHTAEQSLETAQASAKDAQEGLNRAREDAKARLEDLQISLKGAALDEEAATLALEKAQANLAKLKASGAKGLDLREAELGARQAAQTLVEVKNRYQDMQKQATYAAKTGVEGDSAVQAAHKQVRDTAQQVQSAEVDLNQARLDGARSTAQAQRDVTKANDDVAKAQVSAAQGQADALKSVEDAQRNLTEAVQSSDNLSAGNSAADKLNVALSKLSPAGRSFVTMLQREMKPALKDLGGAVQQAMLPKFEEAFRTLLQLTPFVSKALADTGAAFGDIALKGANMVTSMQWKTDFATIAATNTFIIGKLGDSFLSVVDAMKTLMVVTGPGVRRFFELTAIAAERFATNLDHMRLTGDLQAWFAGMFAGLKDVWNILATTGRAIWDLGVALAPLGGALLHIIEFVAKFISGFTEANPVLTNIIATIYLFVVALLFLGKSMVSIPSAFKGAINGFSNFGKGVANVRDRLDRLSGSTSRFAGAAGGLVHPLSTAAAAGSTLAQAYKQGADKARVAMGAQTQLATRSGILAQAYATQAASAGNAGNAAGQLSTRSGILAAAYAKQAEAAGTATGGTGALAKGYSGAVTSAQQFANGIKTHVVGAFNAIGPAAAAGSWNLNTRFPAAMSGAVTSAQQFANGIKTHVVGAFKTVTSTASSAGDTVRTAVPGGLTRMTSALMNASPAATYFGQSLRNNIIQTAETARMRVGDMGTSIKNGMGTAATAIRNPTDTMNRAITGVATGLYNTQGAALRFGGSMATTLAPAAGAVTRFAGTLKTALSPTNWAQGLAAFRSGMVETGATVVGTGAAIKTGLKSMFAGLTGALGGPWGLLVTAAIVGLTLFMSAQAKAKQQTEANAKAQKAAIDTVAEAFKNSNGVLDDSVRASTAKALADKNVAKFSKEAGLSFASYTDAALGNTDALSKVTESSDGLLRSIGESVGLGPDFINMLVGLNHEALNTGKGFGELADGVNFGEGEFVHYTDAQMNAIRATIDSSGALRQQIKATEEGRVLYLQYATAASHVDENTIKLWESQKKLLESTKELVDANLSLRDATAALDTSQQDSATAQDKYNQAVKEHGKDSTEAKDALKELNDARRQEEHNILAVVNASDAASKARNQHLPEAERDHQMALDHNVALKDLAATYKGELPQALTESIAGLSAVDAMTAGFRVNVDKAGKAVVQLPNGKTVTLTAKADPAIQVLHDWEAKANASWSKANVGARIDAATGEVQKLVQDTNGKWAWTNTGSRVDQADGQVQKHIQRTDGSWAWTNTGTRIDAADGQVQSWVIRADGTWGWVNTGTRIDAATGQLEVWKVRADGTKGWVKVDAKTEEGQRTLTKFAEEHRGTPIDFQLSVQTQHALDQLQKFKNDNGGMELKPFIAPGNKIGYTNQDGEFRIVGSPARAKAQGGILEFFAAGGFSQMNKMSAGVAEVVPPNTMRVIGDRAQGDEAYIPINKDPRSIAILQETALRMGFALTPMALGGILAMADGGVTAPATAIAPAVSSSGVLTTAVAITTAAFNASTATVGKLTATTGVLTATTGALTATTGMLNVSAGSLNTTVNTLTASAATVAATITDKMVPAITTAVERLSTVPAAASAATSQQGYGGPGTFLPGVGSPGQGWIQAEDGSWVPPSFYNKTSPGYKAQHHYDQGGWLPPGYSTVANHTGKPEAILTQGQWNALTSMASATTAPGRSITVHARTDASPDHIAHTIDRHLAIATRL